MKYGRIDELRQVYPVAARCAGFWMYQRVATTPGANARRRCERRPMRGWKSRSRRRTSGHGRPMAPNACKPIWPTTASRRASIASSGFARAGATLPAEAEIQGDHDSKHGLPVAPNLLNRQFAVSARNQVWVTDIIYIATDDGWLYLAGIKDLFNGELVGYALEARMTQQLVMQALFRAVAAKRPGKGLIQHSDRGSQYCAHAYQKLLQQFGMQASMSRRVIAGTMHRWKAAGVP